MKNYRKILSLILLFLSIIPSFASISCAPRDVLTIDFLRTGASDCTVINVSGKTVIIDAGEKNDFETISGLLSERGINTIDLLILTHFDNDHIGSAGNIVYNFKVKEIIAPDYERSSDAVGDLERACRQRNISVDKIPCGSENIVRTFNEATFTVNIPSEKEYTDENNYSLITSLSFKGENFLFMADALKERIEEYSQYFESSYYAVKLPHHGDYTSKLGDLFASSKIRYAIVTSETTDIETKLEHMIADKNPKGLYTCNGTITIEYDDEKFTVWQ